MPTFPIGTFVPSRPTGRYEKITGGDTDSGDHEIHERTVVEGNDRQAQSNHDHYAFPTIESFVEKHNRYSNWEAVVESNEPRQGRSLQHKESKENGS